MKIHIPNIDLKNHNRKVLFILTRPFYTETGWKNAFELRERWQVSGDYRYVATIENADVLFIPNPINTYSKKQLNNFNALCKKHTIKGYGYISGDLGEDAGNFSHLIFFRMGGFKSQLASNNRGFPVILSDDFERLFNKKDIELRLNRSFLLLGFVGIRVCHFQREQKKT